LLCLKQIDSCLLGHEAFVLGVVLVYDLRQWVQVNEERLVPAGMADDILELVEQGYLCAAHFEQSQYSVSAVNQQLCFIRVGSH
jgi:hypothetical protein